MMNFERTKLSSACTNISRITGCVSPVDIETFTLVRQSGRSKPDNHDMETSGSLHCRVMDYLVECMIGIAKNKAIVRVQSPIQLKDFSILRPDLSLHRLTDNYFDCSLPGADDTLLIIDVIENRLTPNCKPIPKYYASQGIPEYWSLSIPDEQFLVHRKAVNGDYQDVQNLIHRTSINVCTVPEIRLPLAGIRSVLLESSSS